MAACGLFYPANYNSHCLEPDLAHPADFPSLRGDEARVAARSRVALAIFDAGGAAPLCQLLALAAKMLVDPPGRRPRGRRLSTGESEADGMMLILPGVELAFNVLFYALRAGRDDSASALDREGVDPVARAVLDAGGHIATTQLLAAARAGGTIPAAIRNMLDRICEKIGAGVLAQLALRPRVWAATRAAEAAAAAD